MHISEYYKYKLSIIDWSPDVHTIDEDFNQNYFLIETWLPEVRIWYISLALLSSYVCN